MRVAIEKKAPKPKACKNPACRGSFVPQRLGQAVCSPKCALATVEVQKAKEKKSLALAGRRDIKVRKEALKTRADHAKEAQMVMNRYVRLRDAHLGWPMALLALPQRRRRRTSSLQPLEHEQVLLPVQCPPERKHHGLPASPGREDRRGKGCVAGVQS